MISQNLIEGRIGYKGILVIPVIPESLSVSITTLTVWHLGGSEREYEASQITIFFQTKNHLSTVSVISLLSNRKWTFSFDGRVVQNIFFLFLILKMKTPFILYKLGFELVTYRRLWIISVSLFFNHSKHISFLNQYHHIFLNAGTDTSWNLLRKQ
jgi:hypothetical protein